MQIPPFPLQRRVRAAPRLDLQLPSVQRRPSTHKEMLKNATGAIPRSQRINIRNRDTGCRAHRENDYNTPEVSSMKNLFATIGLFIVLKKGIDL